MKLTVSIITYNHASFIAQAIDSALAQQTRFDFNILIGEDDSNDGTREIVRAYEARYPNKIRAFYHRREDNLMIHGKPNGRRNWVNNLRNADGEYVAVLDGDDYWTDQLKLQKQVDLLDNDPTLAACYHDIDVKTEGVAETTIFPMKLRAPRICLRDILVGDAHIPTLSLVYRRGLFDDFPDWYFKLYMGDLPLHMLNALKGDFAFIDEKMGVYRIHGGGAWASGADFQKRDDAQLARQSQRILEFYEVMRDFLPEQYRALCREQLSKCAYSLAWYHQSNGDLVRLREVLRLAGKNCWFPGTVDPMYIIKAWTLAFTPGAFRAYAARQIRRKGAAAESK